MIHSQGTAEEKGLFDLKEGQSVDVYVEYTNTLPPNAGERSNSQPGLMRGVVRSFPNLVPYSFCLPIEIYDADSIPLWHYVRALATGRCTQNRSRCCN